MVRLRRSGASSSARFNRSERHVQLVSMIGAANPLPLQRHRASIEQIQAEGEWDAIEVLALHYPVPDCGQLIEVRIFMPFDPLRQNGMPPGDDVRDDDGTSRIGSHSRLGVRINQPMDLPRTSTTTFLRRRCYDPRRASQNGPELGSVTESLDEYVQLGLDTQASYDRLPSRRCSIRAVPLWILVVAHEDLTSLGAQTVAGSSGRHGKCAV